MEQGQAPIYHCVSVFMPPIDSGHSLSYSISWLRSEGDETTGRERETVNSAEDRNAKSKRDKNMKT